MVVWARARRSQVARCRARCRRKSRGWSQVTRSQAWRYLALSSCLLAIHLQLARMRMMEARMARRWERRVREEERQEELEQGAGSRRE